MPIDVRTFAASTAPPFLLPPYVEANSSDTFRKLTTVLGGMESYAVSPDQARFRGSLSEMGWALVAQPVNASLFDAMLGQSLFPALVDKGYMDDERRRGEQLDAKLTRAFEDTPIEDGINHPAERIIDEALASGEGRRVLERLGQFAIDADRPELAASVLRCLGRQHPATAAWRAGVVRSALRANDVQVRDAAAQAAESWGGPEVRQALRSHHETVPWLRAYIADILDDAEA